MTELMNDEIVGEMRREESDAIIEAECPLLRTTAPTRFLVFDQDLLQWKIVVRIEVSEASLDEISGRVFVLLETDCAFANWRLGRKAVECRLLAGNPVLMCVDETHDFSFTQEKRRRHGDRSIRMGGEAEVTRASAAAD